MIAIFDQFEISQKSYNELKRKRKSTNLWNAVVLHKSGIVQGLRGRATPTHALLQHVYSKDVVGDASGVCKSTISPSVVTTMTTETSPHYLHSPSRRSWAFADRRSQQSRSPSRGQRESLCRMASRHSAASSIELNGTLSSGR